MQIYVNKYKISRHLWKEVATILETVAAIFDFQMFTYLGWKNASKLFCVNYHASVAIINYLDK